MIKSQVFLFNKQPSFTDQTDPRAWSVKLVTWLSITFRQRYNRHFNSFLRFLCIENGQVFNTELFY